MTSAMSASPLGGTHRRMSSDTTVTLPQPSWRARLRKVTMAFGFFSTANTRNLRRTGVAIASTDRRFRRLNPTVPELEAVPAREGKSMATVSSSSCVSLPSLCVRPRNR